MSCDQKYVLVFNWSSYKSRHALYALLGALTVSAAAAEENRSVEVGAKLLNLDSKNGVEFRKISPLKTADAIKLLDELIELAGEEHHGPLPLFEKSSVYYQDPAAARSKFVSYSDFCEVNQSEVKPFFTGDMWDQEDFSKEFNYYAAKLYSLIAGDEDL